MNSLLPQFREALNTLDVSGSLQAWPEPLLIRRDGDWATYYAPFDHINTTARVVLVGITPGLQQAGNALAALQSALRRGESEASALETAKKFASFSGPMRPNLIALLDSVGLPAVLGIATTAELFGDRSSLVHYTSALRYPVTFKGNNYSGSGIAKNSFTRHELLRWFPEETAKLPDAIYVPLGGAVEDALQVLVGEGALRNDQILGGLPHPSGANGERIAYFLGRKPRVALSIKVDPEKLDAARVRALATVKALAAV